MTYYGKASLDEREWSALHPGRFTPGKDPGCPLYRKLDGFLSRSGRFEEDKISSTCRDSIPTSSSSYLSYYIDCAVMATIIIIIIIMPVASRGQHRLRMLANKKLRKMFGPMRKGSWRKFRI